jgi:hypothetical protein
VTGYIVLGQSELRRFNEAQSLNIDGCITGYREDAEESARCSDEVVPQDAPHVVCVIEMPFPGTGQVNAR